MKASTTSTSARISIHCVSEKRLSFQFWNDEFRFPPLLAPGVLTYSAVMVKGTAALTVFLGLFSSGDRVEPGCRLPSRFCATLTSCEGEDARRRPSEGLFGEGVDAGHLYDHGRKRT